MAYKIKTDYGLCPTHKWLALGYIGDVFRLQVQ